MSVKDILNEKGTNYELPEKFNLKILQFLKEQRDLESVPSNEGIKHFFNSKIIAEKIYAENEGRVSGVLNFLYHKGFVERFSDLEKKEQREIGKKIKPEILSSRSYRLTDNGNDKYSEILTTCLDEFGQKLLHLRKMNS